MAVLPRFFRRSEKADRNDPHYKLVKELIGHPPNTLHIYKTAFTHKSSGNKDAENNVISYERLEFLGDSILGAIISDHIYSEVPGEDEGYLTKMRSKIVSRQHLNELGQDFELGKHLISSVPLRKFGPNIYGNLFESFIGALYKDQGYRVCRRFIHNRVIEKYVDLERLEGKITSYKSLMIEWCQKRQISYKFLHRPDDGLKSEKPFSVTLKLDGKVKGKGRGRSKKLAEEKAAQRAYYAIQDKS